MSAQESTVSSSPHQTSSFFFSHRVQHLPTALPIKRGRGRPPVHKKDANGRAIIEYNPDGSRKVPVQKYEKKVRAGGSQSSKPISKAPSAPAPASTSESRPAKAKANAAAGGVQVIGEKKEKKKRAARIALEHDDQEEDEEEEEPEMFSEYCSAWEDQSYADEGVPPTSPQQHLPKCRYRAAPVGSAPTSSTSMEAETTLTMDLEMRWWYKTTSEGEVFSRETQGRTGFSFLGKALDTYMGDNPFEERKSSSEQGMATDLYLPVDGAEVYLQADPMQEYEWQWRLQQREKNE